MYRQRGALARAQNARVVRNENNLQIRGEACHHAGADIALDPGEKVGFKAVDFLR